MRLMVTFSVMIALITLGLCAFLVIQLSPSSQATRLQCVDATPDLRQPQVGELWAWSKPDPSPWEDPTIIYEVCEVRGDWIRYTWRRFGTCAEAQARGDGMQAARRAVFVHNAWRLDQRITAPTPPVPGD